MRQGIRALFEEISPWLRAVGNTVQFDRPGFELRSFALTLHLGSTRTLVTLLQCCALDKAIYSHKST